MNLFVFFNKASRVLASGFLLLSISLEWGHAASWEDEKREWEKISSQRFYKDPGYAAKLSLSVLPIDNGHFYVGDVGKGIWSSVGQTVSLGAIAIPLLGSTSRSKKDLSPIWTDGMVITASVGAVSYIFLKVWSGYDAAESARRYNERQREKRHKQQSFLWDLSPSGVQMAYRW